MSDSEKLSSIFKWIETQIKNNPYAEISIKLCTHDGRVRRIERGLVEKVL